MYRRTLLIGVSLVVLACCAACVAHQRQLKSSALEFLYPEGSNGIPPRDVTLQFPLRVGLAFAPEGRTHGQVFTEVQKQSLLDRVAEAFRSHERIRFVEVIPATFLEPGGSFENLDRLVASFGIDVMVLIAYDQFQFSESGRSSWAYWTLIGAYVVRGEKNETRTVLDAVVYDISSRTMLFHASGQSSLSGKATPMDIDRSMRKKSEQGFEQATADLIVNSRNALAEFGRNAASGTVRGEGTPAIAMIDESGQPVESTGGGGGAGALGTSTVVLALVLIVPMLVAQRRRRSPI